MATDISDLGNKQKGEKWYADESNRLVAAVQECQNGVKTISIKGASKVYTPDDGGNCEIVFSTDDISQVLTVKLGDSVVTDEETLLVADAAQTFGVQFKEYYTDSEQRVAEEVILRVYTRSNSSASWSQKYENKNFSTSGKSSTTFTDIDFSSILSNGTQQVRVEISGTSKSDRVLDFVVMVANLSIGVPSGTSARWYDMAVRGTNGTTARYSIGGTCYKTLHVRAYTVSGTVIGDKTYTVGTREYSTDNPRQVSIDLTNYGDLLNEAGVHKLEAWVTAYADESQEGTMLESEHLTNRLMVVPDGDTGTYIAFQEFTTSVINYDFVTLCRYSAFKDGNTDGLSLTFVLVYTQSGVLHEAYRTTVTGVMNETPSYLQCSVEVPVSTATLNVYCEDELLASMPFKVDNSVDYAPTSGYSFRLNPKTRNNTEENPEQIINAADGSVVETDFYGMQWTTGNNASGWVTDDDGQKCLRIPAGSAIDIKYDPYSVIRNASNCRDNKLSIEVVFAVRNVTNEDDPILQVCDYRESGDSVFPVGMQLNAVEGYTMTSADTKKSLVAYQWEEGKRVHVIVDYYPQEDITHDNDTQTLTAVKTFINGVKQRESKFTPSASSYTPVCTANAVSVRIGQRQWEAWQSGVSGADIDIYDIYVYHGDSVNDNHLTDRRVEQNTMSALSTSEEKKAWYDDNDIVDESTGRISYTKAVAKGYNCLLWHGQRAGRYKGDTGKSDVTYGYDGLGRMEITVNDDDKNLIRESSGTLYGCVNSGQGTSAMNYWEWNQRQKKNKTLASDDLKFVDVDGNVTSGFGYTMPGMTKRAKDLCGKANVASSMQTHKIGSCNAYNDLYHACVGNSAIPDSVRVATKQLPFLYFTQESASATPVFQGLMTWGPSKGDEKVFGLDAENGPVFSMLEGAANNVFLADFRVPFATDGSITKDSDSYYYHGESSAGLDFDYGATDDDEVATEQQDRDWAPILNFIYLTMSDFEGTDYTPDELSTMWANGELDGTKWYYMNQSDAGGAYNKYDLYRPETDGTTKNYVKAGLRFTHGDIMLDNLAILPYTSRSIALNGSYFEPASDDVWAPQADGNYITYNIASELIAQGLLTQTELSASTDEQSLLRERMSNLFAIYVNNNQFINKDAGLFHSCYTTIEAASDNRSKNTYYTLVKFWYNADKPAVYVEEEDRTDATLWRWVMELDQDDLDTTKRLNNTGQNTKPYYCTKDTTYEGDDGKVEYYWEGRANVLWNSIENAYNRTMTNAANTNDYMAMMNKIFTAMASLVSDDEFVKYRDKNRDTNYISTVSAQTGYNRILAFYEKYFFSVADYLPACAYNETARIRYEKPSAAGFNGGSIDPITQSLGTQLESEREYVKRRMVMMESYAAYGDYSKDCKSNSINWRGELASSHTFDVRSHYYLYPALKNNDDAVYNYRSKVVTPTDATSTAVVMPAGATGDANRYFLGVNNVEEIGNIGWITLKGTGSFSLTAARLTKLQIVPEDGETECAFNSSGIDLVLPNVREIEIRGLGSSFTQETLDLSAMTKLRKLTIKNVASLKKVILPETGTLEEVHLPDTITEIVVGNCPNLTTLTCDSYANITNVEISAEAAGVSYAMLEALMTAGVTPVLKMYGILWTGVGSSVLNYLLSLSTKVLTGYISTSDASTGSGGTAIVTFALKKQLIKAFGNVDENDTTTGLRMNYYNPTVSSSKLTITGQLYIREDGTYTYELNCANTYFNSFKSVEWSVAWAEGTTPGSTTAEIVSNGVDADIAYTNRGDKDNVKDLLVDCQLTMIDDTTKDATTRTVHVYDRAAMVGDYVYADGEFSDEYDEGKTVVGVCCYVGDTTDNGDAVADDKQLRIMVGLQDLGTACWGLYAGVGTSTIADSARISDQKTNIVLRPVYDTDGTTVVSWKSYWLSDGEGVSANNVYDIPSMENNSSASGFANSYYVITHASGSSRAYLPHLTDTQYAALSFDDTTELLVDFLHEMPTETSQARMASMYTEQAYTNDGWLKPANTIGMSATGDTYYNDCFIHNNLTTSQRSAKMGYKTISQADDEELWALMSDWQKEAWAAEDSVVLNTGAVNTLKIIRHRNRIVDNTISPAETPAVLQDVVQGIPAAGSGTSQTEALDLTSKMSDTCTEAAVSIAQDGDGSDVWAKYNQLYFPAASMCYAYEPTVGTGETLSDKFKAHNWFLPPNGILARIYWYTWVAKISEYAANSDNTAFVKAMEKLSAKMTASYYWSSSEFNSSVALVVSWGSGGVTGSYKSNSYLTVRPVAAF